MPQGTVHAAKHFDAKADAEVMEKAMKKTGCDEMAIVQLLSTRTVHQRQEIALAYKRSFGEDLKDRLRSKLNHGLRTAVLYSFYDKVHANAWALYKAMKGPGTDEEVLIDILCTSTNQEINALKNAYQDILADEKQDIETHNLEKDVYDDTTRGFRRVLIALLQAKREVQTDDYAVTSDCKALYDGGEAKWGTDEEVFTEILTKRSFEHITKINTSYTQGVGHDLIKAIKKKTSGDYARALTAIVQRSMDEHQTLAEILEMTMSGSFTHEEDLSRIIMAHSEIDLADIRSVYDRINKMPLAERIKSSTSGSYRTFLLAILGESK